MIQRMPYPVVNTGVDWLFPAGGLNYWKSAFFSDLSDPGVEVMTRAFEQAPSELCALVVEDFHGAVTRVAPTAMAYPHREPGYNFVLISQWTDPADTDAGIAWARETFDRRRPTWPTAPTRTTSGRRRRPRPAGLRPQLRAARRAQAALRPGQPLPAQPQHRPERLSLGACGLEHVLEASSVGLRDWRMTPRWRSTCSLGKFHDELDGGDPDVLWRRA